MPSQAAPIRAFLLAAVVALGLAMAWAVVAGWTITVATQASSAQGYYEQIYARTDGEPIIVRNTGGSRSFQETLTLDGKPIQVQPHEILYPAYLAPPSQTYLGEASNWQRRLAAINDGGTPAAYWYLVHDGHSGGRAYGVGYHALTRRIVGYFGRAGFANRLPPRSEWFEVRGTTGLSQATLNTIAAEPSWTTERQMHLLADGKLWSIDPQARQVKALADVPPGEVIGWAWVTGGPPVPLHPAGYAAFHTLRPRKPIVRSADSCTLVDLADGKHVTYPLPPELRQTMFAPYESPEGNLVLIAYPGLADEAAYRVVEIEPQGKIVRDERVFLTQLGAVGQSPGAVAWAMLLCVPSVLGQAPLSAIVTWSHVQSGQADTFLAAAGKMLGELWPTLLAALGIGALCAVAAYRRQKRYALPHAAGWALFAFLLGIPGWIAYRLHRGWPVLEDCPACGQSAPRDRAACTDCGADFPPPPLKGMEVFA